MAAVSQVIEKLKAQLAAESNDSTHRKLARTLSNRRSQLAALDELQETMQRAEIKIESTASALRTIYFQMLTAQSTDQVADYSRLSGEIDEEARILQDHLEALKEVKPDTV